MAVVFGPIIVVGQTNERLDGFNTTSSPLHSLGEIDDALLGNPPHQTNDAITQGRLAIDFNHEVTPMNQVCYVTASVQPDRVSQVLPIIEELGLKDSWRQGFPSVFGKFCHTFEAGDPRIAELRRAWKHAGCEDWQWGQRFNATYTDNEIRGAQMLEFGMGTAGHDVMHDASMFDLSSGCPHCHAGSLQIGPLKIQPSVLPKKSLMCQTYDFEYMVAEPLYKELSAAKLTGLELLQVHSTKSKPLAWWQIVPRHVMPRMALEQQGWVRSSLWTPCSVCDRDGYAVSAYDAAPQIAYRNDQLRDTPLPDIAETWECQDVMALHNGAVARGRVLMSPRVFEILRQFRIRSATFTPVLII